MALKAANGAIRDLVDYQFEPRAEGAPAFGGGDLVLPAKVDLRPTLSPVEQQGSTQSCVAQAVAGAYECLVRRHRGLDAYEVSRLFVYYNARATGAETVADVGSSMQRAILGLQAHGACSEESWPFEAAVVNEKPHMGAYDEARRFVIKGAEHVRTDLRLWKQALAQGHPILFTLKIYQSFDRPARRGLIPMPTQAEKAGEWYGHCMLCVGYSDAEEVFIVRNSWGREWGLWIARNSGNAAAKSPLSWSSCAALKRARSSVAAALGSAAGEGHAGAVSAIHDTKATAWCIDDLTAPRGEMRSTRACRRAWAGVVRSRRVR